MRVLEVIMSDLEIFMRLLELPMSKLEYCYEYFGA
jgi:hypothetical protein